MYFLYDILLFTYFICYLPFMIWNGKFHADMGARFGIIPERMRDDLKQKKNIWLHAVSVGEVLAIAPVIKELKRKYPRHRIVLTVTTTTGHALASEKLHRECLVMWSPLDFSPVVNKFLRLIKPTLYVVAETEIWPNQFRLLAKQDVPIVMINGRISDRAYVRYRKMKVFLKGTLNRVAHYCMQSQQEFDRIVALGAKKEKVSVVGNIKYDDLPEVEEMTTEQLGYSSSDQLLVAGSTHPGEEEIVCDAYKTNKIQHPNLRLIIAPRHPERTRDVVNVIKMKGLKAQRLSTKGGQPLDEKAVLVVDTIGQLRTFYALASIVFVGKSFSVGGGHNIIEPAFFGKPIIIGPKMENFRAIVDDFLKENAVIQVQSPQAFSMQLNELLKNKQLCEALGQQAKAVIEHNTGATQRTLDIIGEHLRSHVD